MVVAEWTTLKIARSITFDDPETESGKIWLDAIEQLKGENIAGLSEVWFGRVVESSDDVWFVTSKGAIPLITIFSLLTRKAWDTDASLVSFKSSHALGCH